jgi:hypothetical protein
VEEKVDVEEVEIERERDMVGIGAGGEGGGEGRRGVWDDEIGVEAGRLDEGECETGHSS